jgi:hypothetical protein
MTERRLNPQERLQQLWARTAFQLSTAKGFDPRTVSASMLATALARMRAEVGDAAPSAALQRISSRRRCGDRPTWYCGTVPDSLSRGVGEPIRIETPRWFAP